MKAVILAGGLGTRISEETHLKPKPMVEIGGKPILWHIMKIYASHGINEFIICSGYKGYIIKEYFANYFLHMSDVTFEMKNNKMIVHDSEVENWSVTVVNTGENTMTGGRLARVAQYLDDEPFAFTYGDGLADVNISELIKFHHEHGKIATLTAVQPPGRFGTISFKLSDNRIINNFKEKPEGDGAWINGGFFILSPDALDYIEQGDKTIWERDPLENLTANGQLSAYKHTGFWQPMDTLRDKSTLENLWSNDNAPWKCW